MSLPSLEMLDRTDKQGRTLFRLQTPYQYRLGPGSSITVPEGYVTNLGTIPRFMWWFISPGQLRVAALVHDYLCNEDFADDDRPVYSGYSRWLADAVLYEAMARLGFGWFKRTAVFVAVRSYAVVSGNTKWPERPKDLTVYEKPKNENQ